MLTAINYAFHLPFNYHTILFLYYEHSMLFAITLSLIIIIIKCILSCHFINCYLSYILNIFWYYIISSSYSLINCLSYLPLISSRIFYMILFFYLLIFVVLLGFPYSNSQRMRISLILTAFPLPLYPHHQALSPSDLHLHHGINILPIGLWLPLTINKRMKS